MPKLSLAQFDGVVPRTDATALGDAQAQRANDVKLYRGVVGAWNAPVLEATLPAGRQSIYRHQKPDGSHRWLSWTTQVNVAVGPSADQTDARIYYTGDGAPKKTNWTLSATAAYQDMGVPGPAAAPTLALVAGTNPIAEDRVYVYTYVNAFGSLEEESAPSPPATITATIGNIPRVTMAVPSAGNHSWTKKRIYRSTSGASGANYAFVAEVTAATTTYDDTLTATQLGGALDTIGWAPPPAALEGIVNMAGGVLAGFVGNTVYFSEPYFPHAWPVRYAINVPDPIVGLGAFSNSLVVATKGAPQVITGVVPGSMSVERVPITEPCVSALSVVADAYGVTYASPNGLVTIGPSTQGLVTNALFRRDEWQQYAPETMVGAIFEGRYFGFFQSAIQGNRCLILTRDDTPALSFFRAAALAVHVNTQTGALYYLKLDDGNVYEANADLANPLQYEWKSKRFVYPQAVTFSVYKVDADYDAAGSIAAWNAAVAATQAANQAVWALGDPLQGTLNVLPVNGLRLNGSTLAEMPLRREDRVGTMQVWGDGVLQAEKKLTSIDAARLPAFKARAFEIRLLGNLEVRSVALATTVQDLRA